MKVFISSAAEDAPTAKQIALSLATRGHEIFSPAATGGALSATIRAAIASADIFIFLVSAYSIEPGRYTLSELRMAREKWPTPAGHVLPVVHGEVDVARVPTYLRAVTMLSPTGDIASEVADSVERLGGTASRGRSLMRRNAMRALVIALTSIAAATALATIALRVEGAPTWISYFGVGLVSAVAAWTVARGGGVGLGAVRHTLDSRPSQEGKDSHSLPLTDGNSATKVLQVVEGQTKSVFVSYARVDEGLALPLAQQLRDRGVPVWVDQWDVVSGEDWDESIDKALRSCHLLLLLLSPRSVESREVRGEWMTALDQATTIVPVLLETCQVPRQLIAIQSADFRGNDRTSTHALDALAASIGKHLASGNRVVGPQV